MRRLMLSSTYVIHGVFMVQMMISKECGRKKSSLFYDILSEFPYTDCEIVWDSSISTARLRPRNVIGMPPLPKLCTLELFVFTGHTNCGDIKAYNKHHNWGYKKYMEIYLVRSMKRTTCKTWLGPSLLILVYSTTVFQSSNLRGVKW
jgi:hypothetical protein